MVICSPQLGLNPKSVLGGEVYDREILLGLARKGIKIVAILPKGKPHDKSVKNWKITYVPFSHFPAIISWLLYFPYLYILYKKEKFSAISIHQPQFLGPVCLIFKILAHVKLVVTFHRFEETNFGLFAKLINNLWDQIICDSEFVKQKIVREFKIDSKKITVVHNGVPNYLKPAKKDKMLAKKFNLDHKIVLLFMGLFINRKNPLFLLDVLGEISKSNENVVIIFLGKGPLKDKISQKAKALKIENKIILMDPVFESAKNKIHNLADIFVHPSLDEGFALAPLEAMACAKPVLMTDGYSAKEAVEDGTNGFLCRPNDLENWAKKLTSLVNNKSLREKMGNASLKKVKREFQWELAIQKHIEVFNALVK